MIRWLAGGALLAVAAGAVAAHLPGRLKLLGLFAVGFGLLCGWGLGELAPRVLAERRRAVIAVGSLLILLGLLALTGESYRLYRLEKEREYAGNPVGVAAAQMQARGGVPAEVAEEFARAARERRDKLDGELRLPAFFAHRLRQFASWSAPWPMLFWGGEVLLGMAAGTWLLARVVSLERAPQPPLS